FHVRFTDGKKPAKQTVSTGSFRTRKLAAERACSLTLRSTSTGVSFFAGRLLGRSRQPLPCGKHLDLGALHADAILLVEGQYQGLAPSRQGRPAQRPPCLALEVVRR